MTSTDQLVTAIIDGIQEKKGVNITLLNLKKIDNAVASCFILCTGTSDTHLDSISQSIEHVVEETLDQHVWNREGKTNKEWILLDYSDVVVHIFRKETREKYNLENLWGDAETIHISEQEEQSL